MKFLIFAIFAGVCLVQSKLSIRSPAELRTNEESLNGIRYTIANFGRIPYGAQMIGQIYYLRDQDGCSPIKSTPHDIDDNIFFLIGRGNCTFVKKARNAEAAGAKMTIILDEVKEQTELITMMDDGFGEYINIPTIMIDMEDGLSLKQNLKHFPNIELLMEFTVEKFNQVNVTLWIDYLTKRQSEKQSVSLIGKFGVNLTILSQQSRDASKLFRSTLVSTDIVFPLSACYDCEDYNQERDNCLGGGEYCAVDPDGPGAGTGRDVLLEYIRQLCIFKANLPYWVEYHIRQYQYCPLPSQYTTCSKEVLKDIFRIYQIKKEPEEYTNFMQKINLCFQESFQKDKTSNQNLQKNSILQEQLKTQLEGHVPFWPAVTINNVLYRGSLEGEEIFEAVCARMASPPSVCYSSLERANVRFDAIQSTGHGFWIYIGITVFILLLFFVFLMIYNKRSAKFQYENEMKGQVTQLVGQYIQYYESKEKQDKGLN